MSIDIETTLKKAYPDFEILLKSRPATHYKVYKIPKRTIGHRIIAQPTPRVKAIQSDIIKILKEYVYIHDAATAYVDGRNILDNAQIHQNSVFLLKLDLVNFFNRITPEILFKALSRQGLHISDDNKNILRQFCFWNRSKRKNGALVLSVGAPSSPFISNVVMKSFDEELTSFCESNKINYSRYADDLTFSTNERDVLGLAHQKVKTTLSHFFGTRIIINNNKIVYSSKAHNRHVTGVTLTNDNKLSIGRERKRYISSLVFKFKEGKLSGDDINHLKGLIGFSFNIEPLFIGRLEKKYGKSTIKSIKKHSEGGVNGTDLTE
ncbi:retron St85 family RNA-directed DNA polymerase [Klebsiella sp. BIGb0407]|uniref:retron St85 family RNA-directed DNA polymerase n=1 Tax=Klebsiella sp. BIGb0407 TaxID=2940603 RepID=UPI00216A10DD|nr:retron St85 family RNA-directed DNA polymerase [Klebsiella sp. BIGb0407]MCS3433346.1 RNA-directed DNA polymerase [Klebsiella sp. BIGb0407]